MNKIYTVLTGDVVGSSHLSAEQHRQVVEIIKSIPEIAPDSVVGKVDVYSGDGWQMLLSDLDVSLRVPLYLRASLKREKGLSVDSRVSIVSGDVDMESVNPVRISESTGELFTVSGRALQELKKTARMCFSAPSFTALSATINGAVRLIDILVHQWSREQARAVAETMRGRTQVEIADDFGIAQSAVHKSLKAAHWPEIQSVLESLNFALKITLQGDNP